VFAYFACIGLVIGPALRSLRVIKLNRQYIQEQIITINILTFTFIILLMLFVTWWDLSLLSRLFVFSFLVCDWVYFFLTFLFCVCNWPYGSYASPLIVKKSIELNWIVITLAWLKALRWGSRLQGSFGTSYNTVFSPLWMFGLEYRGEYFRSVLSVWTQSVR